MKRISSLLLNRDGNGDRLIRTARGYGSVQPRRGEERSVSSYTIVNLMDVEDTVSVPEIEGRFGRKHLDSEHLGVSLFRYAPGHRAQDGHRHREQEEAYVVVEGSGRILLDGEVHEL